MIRARLCEVLAKLMGLNAVMDAAFLTGLFSTLDAILDKPMDKVLRSLPLVPEINDALLNGAGDLAQCLQFALAYMEGDWDKVNEFVERYNINVESLTLNCNQVYLWLSNYQNATTNK